MEVLTVDIDSIIPYENNAKEHPKEQIEQIKKSITDFGNNDPIAVDENNVIIEGHGRYIALTELGHKTAEIIRLSHLTDEQKKAYRLVHNKLTMNSEFDIELLQNELSELQILDMQEFGFDFLPDLSADGEPEDIDLTEELDNIDEPITKRGDVWQLGRHRLICGDSTDANVVRTLMSGAKANLLMTDPPYNVAVENSDGMTIANDDMSDAAFYKLLTESFGAADSSMRDGASYYIWHGESEGYNFRRACQEVGWDIRQCIVWVKNQSTLGRQDYQWRHEPCLYGWKSGAAHYFIKNRKQSTVIDNSIDIDIMTADELRELLREIQESETVLYCDKPQRNAEHPTMKPVPLIKKLIKNSTRKNDNVLDIFGGSGTTLIACEEMERTCYIVELDERYCDVIIKRWELQTGQKAINVTE